MVVIVVYRRIFCDEFSMAWAYTEMWAHASVKIRKTRHKISVDIRTFLQCTGATLQTPCRPVTSGHPVHFISTLVIDYV